MPELRQNIATKEWVIIAKERALRPHDFKAQKPARAKSPETDPDCPFCPGNEKMTDTAFTLGPKKGWKARAVRNKFPAFVPNAPKPESKGTLYRSLPGEGMHEVIVESPRHDRSLALMDDAQVRDVLSVYQDRFRVFSETGRMALVLPFKNHGQGAGTSLEHPHSQIVGSCVVPANIRHRMDEAQKYFDQNAACVFCRMIEEEKRQGERIVADSKHFTAFILYAALSPFHLWILPKRHQASFEDASPEELADLASVLRTLLRKVHEGLGNPDYNFIIQSAPLDRGTPECFHWYLSLVVRLGKAAGFELGSGMFINTSVPEESAKFLNAVKI